MNIEQMERRLAKIAKQMGKLDAESKQLRAKVRALKQAEAAIQDVTARLQSQARRSKEQAEAMEANRVAYNAMMAQGPTRAGRELGIHARTVEARARRWLAENTHGQWVRRRGRMLLINDETMEQVRQPSLYRAKRALGVMFDG